MTPLESLNYAKRLIGSLPLDDSALKFRLLNDAHAKLWMAAPWRWTIGALDIVQIASNTQEYAITQPADVLYLSHAWITDGDHRHDLIVLPQLPAPSPAIKGNPELVAYREDGSNSYLRFWPTPPTYDSGPRVISLYKKELVAIDSGNEGNDYSTLGIPAEWAWVYQEIVLLKAYQFSQSPRVGSITFVDGKVQYSGQYGAVEAAIAEMRQAEKKFIDSLGGEVRNG